MCIIGGAYFEKCQHCPKICWTNKFMTSWLCQEIQSTGDIRNQLQTVWTRQQQQQLGVHYTECKQPSGWQSNLPPFFRVKYSLQKRRNMVFKINKYIYVSISEKYRWNGVQAAVWIAIHLFHLLSSFCNCLDFFLNISGFLPDFVGISSCTSTVHAAVWMTIQLPPSFFRFEIQFT